MLIYILFDLKEFDKRTQALNAYETFKLYFKLGNLLKICIGAILIILYVNISTMVGGEWLIKYTSGGLIDGDTPAELHFFVVMVGLVNQVIVDKLFNILDKNVTQIELK